jgi:hypothetical protein
LTSAIRQVDLDPRASWRERPQKSGINTTHSTLADNDRKLTAVGHRIRYREVGEGWSAGTLASHYGRTCFKVDPPEIGLGYRLLKFGARF